MKSVTPVMTVGILWVVIVIGCAAPSNRSHSVTSPANSEDFQLELLSYRGERGYDFLTVEGQVRNISGEKLEGVMAVVECYASDGSIITSEDGVLEYSPVMPGQTSPFKVMIRDNPLIKTFKVNFKYMFGGAIPFKNSTPTESPKSKKNNRNKKAQ